MGLIGDIVESFKAALRIIPDTFSEIAAMKQSDLNDVVEAMLFEITGRDLVPELAPIEGLADKVASIAEFTAEALADPKRFMAELFTKWSEVVNAAFGALNIDSPGQFEGIDFGNPDIAASSLRVQGDRAGLRVTAAITAINVVVLSGNAASIAAELATVGTVRSLSEAIQSWIWANGLGGLSGMAYQPQLNASVFPWLNRKFAFAAQASLPNESDMVRFQLREVFQPIRRAELLQGEARPVFNHYMQERGFNEYWADSFWAAHWVLPSIGQLNEMLFRGIIDREEWERFVRFNDFDPSSIPRLGEIIFNTYTRVDVRRMADLGVLTEDEQLQAYADLGNFAETEVRADGRIRAVFKPNPDFTVDKAQGLVVFTRLFNALPDLRARFKNGWISQEELLEGIIATGVPAVRAQVIWETVVKAEKEARVAPEKELTRGLVARAWKLRFISFPQAVFLLERMGWDAAEAELILRVQSVPDDPLAFVQTNLGLRLGAAVGVIRRIEEEEE